MVEIIKLKQPISNENSVLNKLKWFVLLFVFVASLVAHYYFSNIAEIWHALYWLGVCLIGFGLFVWTTQGKAVVNFAKASRNELRKVVWPTRQETIQSTVAVIVLVAILALLLWVMDSLWLWLITLITG